MGTFGNSMKRELGKNTGKWLSNSLFGDSWSTPHKVIVQREREERKVERDEARNYRLQTLQNKQAERDFQKELKQREKEDALKDREILISENTKKVNNHNNYLNIIQTVHKDYSNKMDWDSVLKQLTPEVVKPLSEEENNIKDYTNKVIDSKISELNSSIALSFMHKYLSKYYTPKYNLLFKILDFKMFTFAYIFMAVLTMAISKNHIFITFVFFFYLILYFILNNMCKDYDKINELDEQISFLNENRDKWVNENLEKHGRKYKAFVKEKKEYDEMISIANGIKNNDLQSYIYAINFFKPFADLKDYGSDISCSSINGKLQVNFYVHSESVIPNTTKQLMKKGIEIKESYIAKSRFNEIYQDYICSCILRIGKEVFCLLPVNEVLINAKGNAINPASGNLEEKTILSVLIDKSKLDNLNFDLLDPSESLVNFNYNMNFKKSEGFYGVTEVVM